MLRCAMYVDSLIYREVPLESRYNDARFARSSKSKKELVIG